MLGIGAAFPVFEKLFYTCPGCNLRVAIFARKVTSSSVALARKKLRSGKLDLAKSKGKDKLSSKHASPTSSKRKGKDSLQGKKDELA